MKPSLLFVNGVIHPMSGERPVSALAVRDGRVAAAGGRDECARALGPDYQVCDLAGACLTPGFIDTHLHPLMFISYHMQVRLDGAKNAREAAQRMAHAAALRQPGQWVVGVDLDENGFDLPELPDGGLLDEACPANPAVMVRHCGHLAVVNRAALAAAGIDDACSDPARGSLDRDRRGRLTGVLREEAVGLVTGCLPLPSPDELARGAKAAAQDLFSRGITTLGAVIQSGDFGPLGVAGGLEPLLLGALRQAFPLNLRALVFARTDAEFHRAVALTACGEPPDAVCLAGVKLIADGSFGARTAALWDDYTDAPGNRGMLHYHDRELVAAVEWAHAQGLLVAVHAIGDKACRQVVDAFATVLARHPAKEHGLRMEHASLLSPSLVEDLARLDIGVSTQPMFIHSEKHWLKARLGSRTPWVYPLRSLVEAGVPVAGASDAPVESPDVVAAIACSVTREGFETHQTLSPRQALEMYTCQAARLVRGQGSVGAFVPGARADLAVLSADPLAVATQDLSAIKVRRTYLAGRLVYDADNAWETT